MTAKFNPPPTYADPVVVDEVTKRAQFNPLWLKWFLDITGFVNSAGGGTGVVTHNNLTGLQGGAASERYHFTAAEHTALIAGFTGTGVLVRKTGAALVTPDIGVATGTSLAATGAVSGLTVAATNGVTGATVAATGAVTGASVTATGLLTGGDATALVKCSSALNDGASTHVGTLTTAPSVGNPTKWIPIDDNGTTRYIPAW